jgi:hypothetical protein
VAGAAVDLVPEQSLQTRLQSLEAQNADLRARLELIERQLSRRAQAE